MPRVRTASLGTLFLTVFIDLLGFGLVIPFLPGMARRLGASDFVATMPGAVYSVMQFLFIPIWGRLSDRVGRRPVLLWSIAATAAGMALLGAASTLTASKSIDTRPSTGSAYSPENADPRDEKPRR